MTLIECVIERGSNDDLDPEKPNWCISLRRWSREIRRQPLDVLDYVTVTSRGGDRNSGGFG